MTNDRLKELSHPSKDDQLFMEALKEEATGRPAVPATVNKTGTFSACLACRETQAGEPTRIKIPHTCGKDLIKKVGEVEKTHQPTRQQIHKMKEYAAGWKKRNKNASLADVTRAVAKKFNIKIVE